MAREEQEIRYPDYPLFKGLQKPLEFMGIQGRYIYWAAATAGGAIIGFIAAYCLMGIITGLIVLVVAITTGAGLIMFNNGKDCIPRRTTKECLSMPTASAYKNVKQKKYRHDQDVDDK